MAHASRVFGNQLSNNFVPIRIVTVSCQQQHRLSCLRRHSNFAILCISPRTYHLVLDSVILNCCKQLFVRNHESAMLSLSYQRIRTSSICSCDAGISRNGRRTRPQSFRSRPRDADQTWQCPSNSFPQANYPVLRSLAKTWTI